MLAAARQERLSLDTSNSPGAALVPGGQTDRVVQFYHTGSLGEGDRPDLGTAGQNISAIRLPQCPATQTLPHGLLVSGMNIRGIADIKKHDQSRVARGSEPRSLGLHAAPPIDHSTRRVPIARLRMESCLGPKLHATIESSEAATRGTARARLRSTHLGTTPRRVFRTESTDAPWHQTTPGA